MSEFEKMVEAARKNPPTGPMRQAPTAAHKTRERKAAEEQALHASQSLESAQEGISRRARSIAAQLVAKEQRGEIDPDYRLLRVDKTQNTAVMEKARRKRSGNRSAGLGGSSSSRPSTDEQRARWQGQSERYLEKQLAKRTRPGWAMGVTWEIQGSDGEGGTAPYYYGHMLGDRGDIYTWSPRDKAILTIPLVTVEGVETGIDVIGVGVLVRNPEPQRITEAQQGLANLVARFDLDITRIA